MNRFVDTRPSPNPAGGVSAQMRALGRRCLAAWREAARRRAAARADAQFLAYAQFDPRIMAELQAVLSRAEARGEPGCEKLRLDLSAVPSLARARRRMQQAGCC